MLCCDFAAQNSYFLSGAELSITATSLSYTVHSERLCQLPSISDRSPFAASSSRSSTCDAIASLGSMSTW